jgi:tRNA(Arg) A34 adenosine deaminase TadA
VDLRFLERAVELALHNVRNGVGGPFGAVVVKDGEIVGEGANCVIGTNDPTAHAEIVAIRQACQALGAFHIPGTELYTSCEPCPMCLGAIYWAHIGRVYFAATQHEAAAAEFDDSLIYSEIGQEPASRSIPMIRVGMKGRLGPFEEWLQSPHRVRY